MVTSSDKKKSWQNFCQEFNDRHNCTNPEVPSSFNILFLITAFLTLKWSRGVPMDPKISFGASARKRIISWRRRFLTFTCLPPRISWHVFEKNRATRCAAIALGSLWTPRWPPTGRHSTKIIFHTHVTFDLWWLYINVDLWYYHISILIKINKCFINHLHADMYFYPYATCTRPCTKWMGNTAVGKVLGKILKWIKHPIFCLEYIIWFILNIK